jgi:transcription antitermination protein NusB
MRPRTLAREIAFQVLYQDDLNPAAPNAPAQDTTATALVDVVHRLLEVEQQEQEQVPADAGNYRQWLRLPGLVDFTYALVTGVRSRRGEIDDRLARAAANWSLERMAATDRNLLRLGCYELLYTDAPAKVAIDEAVELAKRFGGAQSAQFVNGILDNVMHQKETHGLI